MSSPNAWYTALKTNWAPGMHWFIFTEYLGKHMFKNNTIADVPITKNDYY